jgi:hypothetical protein
MNTLFDFEDQPSDETSKPLKDWSGNEIPVSDNPCVRLYGAMEGKKCKDCKHLTKEYYHDYSYIKCDLRKHTRGPGSDHRVRWQACKRFEQEDK